MIRKASCCCGASEIELEGEPVLNAICHCDSCRRRTGSAFGWSAYFPNERILARKGELARYHVAATDADRFFCRACGTTLYWTSTTFMPGHTGVAGGCFSSSPLPPPNMSATDAKRCAWLALPPGWFASP